MTKNGELAIEVSETRVWSVKDPNDPSRIRPVPLPDELRAALARSA
ncbi:MAG: hypothetical protein R3C97_08730 [Geminicoccaceae bacterium]